MRRIRLRRILFCRRNKKLLPEGKKGMKNIICLLIICAATFGLQSNVSAREKNLLQTVAGRWEGALEYADYKTGERVKLKTVLKINAADDGNAATFSYVYDDFGRVLKSTDAHRIERAANKYFVGKDEFSFIENENQIVLLGEQIDNDKLEPVRTTVAFTADTLTILKETRAPFAFRHQYTLKRATEFEPERTLSPAQMSEDFAIFRRAVTQLHPGLYRYNTPAEIEKNFAEFKSKLKTPLPESEFFKLLAQFTALVRCGHTFLNPLNQTKEVRARMFDRRVHFPFYFRLIDRRMIITGNLSSKKLANGSEITSVNGVPVSQIVDALASVAAADGENTIAARLKLLELGSVQANHYQLFDIYFPLFFPVSDEIFTVEAVDYATKKPTRFQVLAATRDERFGESERHFGKTPTFDDGWKFEIRANSTALLKIGNSITWRLKTIDYKKFIADAFSEMRAKNIKNLIIDWRGNDGGDDTVNVELIKYLTRKTLPCANPKKRFVRVNAPDKDLTNYIEVFDEQMRQFLTNGVPANTVKKSGKEGLYQVLGDAPCQPVAPAANNFTGKTYVISDASNASAAFEFVRAVKTYKLATIVGQETGGNLQGINGDNYFFVRLPYSSFEIDVPVYFQAPLAAQPDAGVIPNLIIKTNIDDVAGGIDTELNYVLKLIR